MAASASGHCRSFDRRTRLFLRSPSECQPQRVLIGPGGWGAGGSSGGSPSGGTGSGGRSPTGGKGSSGRGVSDCMSDLLAVLLSGCGSERAAISSGCTHECRFLSRGAVRDTAWTPTAGGHDRPAVGRLKFGPASVSRRASAFQGLFPGTERRKSSSRALAHPTRPSTGHAPDGDPPVDRAPHRPGDRGLQRSVGQAGEQVPED